MLKNVKCLKCGKNYNGNTGDSNAKAVAFYAVLWTAFAAAVLAVKFFLLR